MSFPFGFLFTDSNLVSFLSDPRLLWGCKGSENQEGSRVVWGKRKIEVGYFGFTIPDKACVQTHVPTSITQQGDDPGVFDQSCHQASLMAQLVRTLSAIQETGFDPWVGKFPWRREWLPTPVFWSGEFHGVAKSRTRLSDFHIIVTITNCPGIFL